jgi:tripartite ATP-independent transporter DctP family solute receptor
MAPPTTRRTLLAGGTMLLAGHAAAQQATTLRLYSANYEASTSMLAYEVSSRTGGRYRIEGITGFDKLAAALGKERAAGGERAFLEDLRNGDFDLVICSSNFLGDYVPEAQVFFIPFLFRDYAHARAVLDGPIGQDILGKLAAHGIIGLAWTEAGFRYLVNSKRPIRSPEDLKGLRLRTPQNEVVVEAFRTLGADPVPTPWGKAVLDALAQGTLDGMEQDIDGIVNFELFRWLKYLSLTGHMYVPAVILMSKAAHGRLSGTERQAFAEAAQFGSQAERKLIDDTEVGGLARLLGVGMAINTDVDKAAFRAALAPAYIKWREQFGDLIDHIQAHP